VVVIMGSVMHDVHMDIGNDVVRSIHSFSSNNLTDGSHIRDLIPSSRGRSFATYSTHSEYQSPEIDLSSSSSAYQSTYKFGDLTKVEVVIPRFDAYQATYKLGDLTKVEVVLPRFDGEPHLVSINQLIPPIRRILQLPTFDGEPHPVSNNQLIPPMRRISTQGVWWCYTHVQPVPMKLDLPLPNYDALPFQDDMDSPPSQSHSNQLTSSSANSGYEILVQPTSSSANSEYEILVPFDLSQMHLRSLRMRWDYGEL